MKRLSLLLLALLGLPCVVLADVITLKDGTKLEGEIKRSGDSYIVKNATGMTTIPIEKVAGIELRPQAGNDAIMDRLRSLRRAAENIADIRQILDRYRAFVDQNPNTPAAEAAQKEMLIWQDRLDHGLVKVADKWMTQDDRDALRAKSTDTALSLHDMLKQGRLKEAAGILERSLQIDPQNTSFLYLHGVLQYQQELLPVSRKSFESVMTAAPDHAPTLNNLAVILWRQHAPIAALGYYDRAMLAAPVSKEILDNVAEALNALPKDLRENIVTKKVVRHFKEQDDTLQKKMSEFGQYRWGAEWVSEKELKKLKDEEKVITDQIAQMGKDFDSVQKRIAVLDRQIAEVINEMNLIDSQTYAPGPNGTVTRLPYPPVFFTLGQQLANLRTERAARVEDLDTLRKAAKKAQSNLPAPKYNGLQKIIDFDGMPLPAGFRFPAPPPPVAPPIPAPTPTSPATQPATTKPAATQPAAAPNGRP